LPKSAQILTETRPLNNQRLFAAVMVIGLFVASCFGTGKPAARALLAFIPVVALIVTVEFTADAGSNLRNRERWRIRRAPMSKGRLWCGAINILCPATVVWIALLILLHPRMSNDLTRELLRLAAGVALLYAVAAIIAAAVALLFMTAGYSLSPVHRHPLAARSVEEFWARRWNILVSAWLHAFIFLPLARRRRYSLGIMLAFLVSGAFHGWPIFFALGTWAAFTTALFFVIHGMVVLAENRFRIQTWPVPVARAWTVIIILGTSPLFIDPGLRLFGL
jgi:membrane bound O-acyltransferase family protein